MVNPLAPAAGPPEPGSDEAQDQLTFVQEYLRTNDPVLALTRAGIIDIRYPAEVTARKLMEKPHIKALIDTVRAAGLVPVPEMVISRETVVSRFDSIYHEARADRDRPSALAANKLIAHMQGYLTTTIDLTIHHTAAEMTTDQLLKIARRGAAIDGEFHEIDVPKLAAPKK